MNAGARVLGGLLLLWAAACPAADWRLEPSVSHLTFHATYEGADAPGVFKQFDVRLRFDPEHPRDGELRVTVMLDSADMASSDVNSAIRQPEWFASERFPRATFCSREIRRTGPGRYVARGAFDIKGKQQEVSVPFSWEQSGKTASMSGELSVNRAIFGIGSGEWASGKVIGLEVKVAFAVKLVRAE